MVSAVGMDKTQNVPQDFSYLAFCRNGVETRCTFCVTSYKMYSQPWRSNKFVSLCEVFRAYNPLINNGLHIFGAHTCFLCVLSVEKCVFVLLGSLQLYQNEQQLGSQIGQLLSLVLPKRTVLCHSTGSFALRLLALRQAI